MKKITLAIICGLLLVSAAGCSGDSNASGNNAGDNTTSQDASMNAQMAPANAGDMEGMAVGGEYVFGKVKSIVGNEVELMVAKQPEMDSEQLPDGGTESMQEGMSSVAIALPAGEASVGGAGGGTELEYTGETITVTIPAGVDIMQNGGEGSIAGIKNGSIIGLFVEDMDSLNVNMVQILE